MKQSIKSIFKNLTFFLFTISLIAGGGVLVAIDHGSTYTKIDNLNKQKELISSLSNLKKDDIELAQIQFNGKSTQLQYEIEKLRNLYSYNFTEQYVLANSKEYLGDLDKLSALTTSFNDEARNYYTPDTKNKIKSKKKLKQSFDALYKQIDNIIFKSIDYSKEKFYIHKNITYGAFFVILFGAIFYRRKLNYIYEDLLYLYNSNNKENYIIHTEEVDAISLRMNRKPVASENPTNLDPVTGINNHKGMINSYAEKKGTKESNFTTVTVLEIDNFSKTNRAFSQEFTQAILKKVAFTISLHERSLDVIARTDYNQFTIILSRSSKEQAFKDIDIIRQSINEIQLKSATPEQIVITVSGGFVVKPNNITLDESIRESKKVLEYSKSKGKNIISQIKDLAENEL